MKLPKYQLRADDTLDTYWFVSEGRKGLITKRIQFTLVNQEGIYNLTFGDEHPDTGELDDLAVSDNGDSSKGWGSLCFLRPLPGRVGVSFG